MGEFLTAIGQPRYFSPDLACDVVEQLIDADEVERALLLLDNMPAFYRDNPTPRMLEIRESLHRQLWTPAQYVGIYSGLKLTDESVMASWALRYHLVEKEVERLGPGTHIMELAPGAHILPAGLRLKGLEFTYESMSLDAHTGDRALEVSGPVIFCAFELIEHSSNEWEIYQNYLKFKRKADVVMLSTPLYTYGGGMNNWRERELGHLRTYTPAEFHKIAAQMFSGYDWDCKTDDTIVLTGRAR